MDRQEALSWFQSHQSEFSGQLLWDEPLSKHTYYRIGGPASYFAVPKTQKDLEWIAKALAVTHIPYFILGLGSNILVSDQGYPGLVIKTNRLNLEVTKLDSSEDRIQVGSSVPVSTLLRKAAQEGWGGLEFLSGIPGTIGGVVRMNAGTHLGEAANRLMRVDGYSIINNSPVIYEKEDFQFQYRKNLFMPQGTVVWAVQWKVDQMDPAMVKKAIDETLLRRKNVQPVEFPSCGSVFMNPRSSGLSAWQVIDRLGLRGYRQGDAQFSEKHSNFIINLGSARASDVKALIELAKKRAQEELGITLEQEVIFVGF